MWWKVNEGDQAVGSPGTERIIQRESPSFGDWTHVGPVCPHRWVTPVCGEGMGASEFGGCFALLLSQRADRFYIIFSPAESCFGLVLCPT